MAMPPPFPPKKKNPFAPPPADEKEPLGSETPEEEAAEPLEDERGSLTEGEFVDEVRDLLARLDQPKAKSPRFMSIHEKKLPL